MTKSLEDIVRDRIARLFGKEFQQLFWNIMIKVHKDLQTPKMDKDLGNDGYSIKDKTFYAVYAIEKGSYNNTETGKKIENSDPDNLGDYNKFELNWLGKNFFESWVFVTKDNLMGKPHQKIIDLNGKADGVTKYQWGVDQIVEKLNSLPEEEVARIFNITFPISKSECNEVETIIDLITYISSNSSLEVDALDGKPADPEMKIYKRFADRCKEIEREITNGLMYTSALTEALSAVGMDPIKTGKVTAYLQSMSVRKLEEAEGDPIKALNLLTDHLEEKLRTSGGNYDYNAIRYYLIREIPQCNVFPNDN